MKPFLGLKEILFPDGASSLPTYNEQLTCVGTLPPRWELDEDAEDDLDEEQDANGDVIVLSAPMPTFLLLFSEEEFGYQPGDLLDVLGEELGAVQCLGAYCGGEAEGNIARVGSSALLSLQFIPESDEMPGFAYALATHVEEGLALAFLGYQEALGDIAAGRSDGGMPEVVSRQLEALLGEAVRPAGWTDRSWFIGT